MDTCSTAAGVRAGGAKKYQHFWEDTTPTEGRTLKGTGYICDQPTCKKFEFAQDKEKPPAGWIIIQPVATVPRAPQAGLVEGGSLKPDEHEPASLLVCSNYCMAVIAIERWEGENSSHKRFMRPKKTQ